MVATLPLLNLASVQTPASSGTVAPASRLEAFAQSMDRAGQQPGELASSESVGAANGSSLADDQARARQALELGIPPDASRVGTGDTILGGLQKLRSVFDISQHKISNISGTNLSGVGAMFEMQREVVHYSLLIDVTSKLTGKTTQAVDQLMKGQ